MEPIELIDVVDYLPTGDGEYNTRPLSNIDTEVIHHSASLTGDPWTFARYHVNHHGWPGIGYHCVIMEDGTAFKTNDDSTVSYHAGNANERSIGICLVGDFEGGRTPTRAQTWSLLRVIVRYRDAYRIDPGMVIGHREVTGMTTECPGNVNLDRLRGAIRLLTLGSHRE